MSKKADYISVALPPVSQEPVTILPVEITYSKPEPLRLVDLATIEQAKADVDDFNREQTADGAVKWKIIFWVALHLPTVLRIVSLLKKALPVKNWKTTISAIIGALAMLAQALGLNIPEEVTKGIMAVSIFLVGFFAKDSNVTGGDTPQ